jgi:hypothetical protein
VTVEETNLFKMMDTYSRDHHHCFLAEMDLIMGEARYSLCFRPTGVNENSANRYACLYLHIGAEEASAAGKNSELPMSIRQMLDGELPKLPDS